MTSSFYWHDYETWGNNPRADRPCQFAALRTDHALNEIGEPFVLFARPSEDLLPSPDACLVTGLSPQQAEAQGIPEAEFARAIQQQMALPGTCIAGYNSIRFDDEVTRFLFYRNLLDPYAHTFRNGNTRWDLIDVLRLAHALRPDGLSWPEREPGVASFRLEDLTAANGIAHVGAHDALSDVRATVALARRLRQAQPRLFEFALKLRDKDEVQRLLTGGQPLLHVSQRYPAARGCLAPILVLADHPRYQNERLCFDLRQDPLQLLDLDDDELQQRLFATKDSGIERLPVKGIKTNAVPMLAPLKTLSPTAAERWAIDLELIGRHAQGAAAHQRELAERLQTAYERRSEQPVGSDPEQLLYAGGFFPPADRREMDRFLELTPEQLARAHPRFIDARLPTLLFRMRARSWPWTLTDAEREDWDAYRFERLTEPSAGGQLTIDAYETRLKELATEKANDPAALALLGQLQDWGERVMSAGG